MTGSAWRDLWVAVVERWLGPDRRSAGRSLVERGGVAVVEPRPGGVSARVTKARSAEDVTVDLSMPVLDEEEIAAIVSAVALDPRMSAAVVTGGLPPQLAGGGGDVRAALMPAAEELTGECSCGAWAEACDHQAALGWHLAELVESDPFVLLMLRGIGREEFVRQVRDARGAGVPTGEPRDPDRGTNAAAAYRAEPQPLPRSAALPWRAGSAIDLGAAPPADSGIDAGVLSALVDDVAQRAVELLQSYPGTGLELSAEEDLVRRAVGLTGTEALEAHAEHLGWAADELAAATDAWRIGGVDALRVLRHRWDAPADTLAAGAASLSGRTRISHNVISAPGMQLRLDRHGKWWRLRPDDELGWVVATEGFDDLADAAEAPAITPGT
jgi:uncharacterized Zn finger protein